MVQAHKFPKPTEEWQMLNNEALDMAIEALQDRPYGEWIEAYASEFEHTAKLAVCSECDWYAGYIAKDYNFCPNCGAKMHKGGDSE